MELQLKDKIYVIDEFSAIDISIPLNFNGQQPNAYGVELAVSKACEYADLVGDTRRGGSVNFEQYTFIPHCNGTHTECVGHITDERISIRACLTDVLMPAVLVSVVPQIEASGDLVITEDAVSSLKDLSDVTALVIRTVPNDASKLERTYDDRIPPYFSADSVEFMVECGIKHLLVDLPSIDRIFDEGKLTNHRIFWNVDAGSRSTNAETRINSTITELIYVPNDVPDGEYLLNLQIAPFESDAAPSRPILFRH